MAHQRPAKTVVSKHLEFLKLMDTACFVCHAWTSPLAQRGILTCATCVVNFFNKKSNRFKREFKTKLLQGTDNNARKEDPT